MSDKVGPQQPFRPSARVWNGFVDAADDYRQRRRLGDGGLLLPVTIPECVAKARNDTGADAARGEVAELTGLATTSPTREAIWFTADLRATAGPVGIWVDDVPEDKIGRIQLAGICLAEVDVLDADHTHAYAASGDKNPQSNFGGPLRILYKPSGTGLLTCVVQVGVNPQVRRKAIADADITSGSYAAASVYIAGSDVGSVDAWFDWMQAGVAAIASGTEMEIEWFDDQEKWIVVAAECQA